MTIKIEVYRPSGPTHTYEVDRDIDYDVTVADNLVLQVRTSWTTVTYAPGHWSHIEASEVQA